jgi:hypothetical protein
MHRTVTSTVAIAIAFALGCGDDAASGVDGGRADAALGPDGGGLDAGEPLADGALPETDGGGVDASLPPIRDDALDPDWSFIEKAERAMDHDTLAAAFTSEGWSPPGGTEIYAARIVDGVDGPAYVLYDAGGGAFSMDYWPASTVKVLAAVGALEYVRGLGFTGAANVTWDSGFGDTLSAIYDRSIRVSSNIDYSRTIRVAGFDWLNTDFLSAENGFPTTVLQRSYVSGVSVRNIPGLTITEGGRTEYVPARSSSTDYGCGSDGNCASLFELTEGVRRIVLDAEIPESERFDLDPSDVAGLTDALCNATPSFFATGARNALGGDPVICHKPGWVPDLDCLDHGVIESPATGERFLLGVSTPETTGTGTCGAVSVIAEHVLSAVTGLETGMPLQPDAGVPIRVQLDDGGATADMRRAYTITIDAEGADRIEVYTDRWPIGEATGGPRFVLTHDYMGGGERLIVVRAFAGVTEVGYRSFRAMIAPP